MLTKRLFKDNLKTIHSFKEWVLDAFEAQEDDKLISDKDAIIYLNYIMSDIKENPKNVNGHFISELSELIRRIEEISDEL